METLTKRAAQAPRAEETWLDGDVQLKCINPKLDSNGCCLWLNVVSNEYELLNWHDLAPPIFRDRWTVIDLSGMTLSESTTSGEFAMNGYRQGGNRYHKAAAIIHLSPDGTVTLEDLR